MATTVGTKSEAATGGKDILPALERLQRLLPLKKRQLGLSPPMRTVHQKILKALAETGKPPGQSEIAAILGSKQSAVHALAVLGSQDLVVLSTPAAIEEKTKQAVAPQDVQVVGAYPMTTASTPHRVVFGGRSINAMCAVDALAISPMFNQVVWIESRCHVTGTPIRILQNGRTIVETSPPALRVGIRWQSFSTSAAQSLCMEMVFLKNEETADAWRKTDPESIEIFTLAEAIELGCAFFLPLLED